MGQVLMRKFKFLSRCVFIELLYTRTLNSLLFSFSSDDGLKICIYLSFNNLS